MVFKYLTYRVSLSSVIVERNHCPFVPRIFRISPNKLIVMPTLWYNFDVLLS